VIFVPFCGHINSEFPDKAGFTLRYNPASGISATLRPAKVVRVKENNHVKS
jgi:hypothetical protein